MVTVLESLISENTHWWGPSQFRKYHYLLGFTRKIGVEFESRFTDKSKYNFYGKLLSDYGFRKTDYGIGEGNEGVEWTYLYDTSSPRKLTRQLKETTQVLWFVGLNTLGGVHINVQMPKEKIESGILEDITTNTTIKSDIEGDMVKYGRLEFKGGFPFLHWQELLIQFIGFSQLLYGNKIKVSSKLFKDGYNKNNTYISKDSTFLKGKGIAHFPLEEERVLVMPTLDIAPRRRRM